MHACIQMYISNLPQNGSQKHIWTNPTNWQQPNSVLRLRHSKPFQSLAEQCNSLCPSGSIGT